MSLTLPRAAHLWFPAYARQACRRLVTRRVRGPIDVLFGVADHFEPAHGAASSDVQRRRVQRWVDRYARSLSQFRDADGRPPQHTFFVPPEGEWRTNVATLATLYRAGYGEVEVHLHHDRDTAAGLERTLRSFTAELAGRFELLARDERGQLAYGFVHGNWALSNARPDGRWCGVDGELDVLRRTGCYADFTLPCAPDASQTRTINEIYYADASLARPRAHDHGSRARAGVAPRRDGLLLIQGPLALDWRRRRAGAIPRLDNAAVTGANPMTAARVRRWVRTGVCVAGRHEWVFVKVHTHGALDQNAGAWLGADAIAFHAALARAFNDGRRYRLHYVTMREMANIVAAAEDGASGNPGDFRDFRLTRPLRVQSRPA